MTMPGTAERFWKSVRQHIAEYAAEYLPQVVPVEVTEVDAGTGWVKVKFQGRDTAVGGFMPVLSSQANLEVGDIPYALAIGSNLLILGNTADAPASGGGGGAGFSAGDVKTSARSTPETGWLLCDGSEVSQTTYADLFAAIGTTFNDGSETAGNFRLPDQKGRSPVGVGLSDDAAATGPWTLGLKAGLEQIQLTDTEMPSHSHGGATGSDGAHSHAYSATQATNTTTGGGGNRLTTLNDDNNGNNDGQTNTVGGHTHTIASNGGDDPHNNVQPSLALNFFIKT